MNKEKKTKENPDTSIDFYIDRIFDKINEISKASKQTIRNINRSVKSKINIRKDEGNEEIKNKLFKTLSNYRKKAFNRLDYIKDWGKNHKKASLTILAGSGLAIIVATVIVGSATAYEYMYNGKVLGVAKNKQQVYKTIDIVKDKLSYNYNIDVKIDKDENISFRRVLGWNLEIDDQDKILNNLTYLRDMNANAYAIVVDGKQIAFLDSKENAREVLNSIKDMYTKKDESIEYKSIDFLEKVSIEKTNAKIRNIKHADEVLEYMLTGAMEKKTHIVQPGETFYDIASEMGLKEKELLSSNPNIVPERLQIGEELVLNRICPLVTVQTKEHATYVSEIDYEVVYEETATLFKGENTVKTAGALGECKITSEIIRKNGEEISRNEISSELIREPQTQVVLKGTKDKPKLVATGRYIYPTRGRLTSRFGPRWGRMHNGIDLAAPTGTKILAADGGTVISAGWERSYGNVVRINHGGNRVTVYAHCSKVFVSKGSKVHQGQHIANVGNTGNSTGSHLHFEVRINGVAQNPLKYLK